MSAVTGFDYLVDHTQRKIRVTCLKQLLLPCPAWYGLEDGALAFEAKGHWFSSGQGTCLACGLDASLGVKEKQPIDVSLPLCLPPFPSLKINVKEKKLLQLRYYLLICSDLIG